MKVETAQAGIAEVEADLLAVGVFEGGELPPELAAVPGADPELARRTARSLRTQLGPPALPWPAALDLERASQMWSMRRKDLAAE